MNTTEKFLNKTVIVTGGTGTLGRVVAKRFFEAGAFVALPLRRHVAPQELFSSIPDSRLFVYRSDLTVESDVQSFVAATLSHFGTLHILINVAGGYAGGRSIAEMSMEEWEGMFTLNLKTTFLMSRAALSPMLKRGWGRIINIGALPALRSGASKGAYAASKSAVLKLTEIIADECKGTGVTANAIAPGMILGDEQIPTGADRKKYVSPEQIVEVMLFLASAEASGVNGTVVNMYGAL